MDDARPLLDPRALAERAGVRLRAAEPEDVEALGAIMGDPGVIHGTLQAPFTSNAQRRERFRFADPHLRCVVAEAIDTGEVLGSGSLHRNANPRRIHSAGLGMAVRDAAQGRGIGTALLAALVDVADNWWQLRRVHLEVYTDNAPAIALYQRFGFEIEGTLRGDAFREGEWVDSYAMARLRGGAEG